MVKHIKTRMAGPDANADARKRGASIAVSQKGLATSPENIKAVTVWILIAHGIDIKINILTQKGCGSAFLSAFNVLHPIIIFMSRYIFKTIISQNSNDFGEAYLMILRARAG